MYERSVTVGNRADLARLANFKGSRLAVEVGTDRGMFAKEFLDRWNGEMLYCVDTWEPYLEMPWDRSGDFAFACAVLAPYANRVRILRASSAVAASYFGSVPAFPTQVDLVYIDAAHSFDRAYSDIKTWFPIVRPGGILAGDDFDAEHSGVVDAVRTFAEENSLRVDLTTDYDRAPSWYIEIQKPEHIHGEEL